jgi:hypothetical protein
MDIVRFHNPTSPTKMERGEIINNLKSKMWIERFGTAGEFEIVADVSSGARTKLPIGCFITHVDTQEIMMVENHLLSEEKNSTPEIKITGSGLEAFMKERVTGHWNSVQVPAEPYKLHIPSLDAWAQAVYMIKSQLFAGFSGDTDDTLPYVVIEDGVGMFGIPEPAFYVERGDLYSAVTKFLAAYDLGMKVVRPSGAEENTRIIVHEGVYKAGEIMFSHDTGDIENAEYLWSIVPKKNSAHVVSQYMSTAVFSAETGINRRWMTVDATDLDEQYETAPINPSPEWTALSIELYNRGVQALASQKEVALVKAEVAKNVVRKRHRVHFNVGDFITIGGEYNTTKIMRVTEYVEIEDEHGETAYPTLSSIEE